MDQTDTWVARNEVPVYYAQTHLVSRWLKMIFELQRFRPSHIYINSYWHPSMALLPALLHRSGFFRDCALVVAPRGEFAPEALARHAPKKMFVMRVNRLLGTYRGVTWHASTSEEAADIRKVCGPDVRVIVREDDHRLPSEPVQELDFGSGRRQLETLRVCFLSRIVEHKGLHIALEALKSISAPVTLDVFGPVEDKKYYQNCLNRAKDLEKRVKFHGVVDPARIIETLSEYDAMILPTRSENFGHVIAEALAAGCPVVTTSNTPWTQLLVESGGGSVVERSINGFASELERYSAFDMDQRRLRREDARKAYRVWRKSTLSLPHVFALFDPSS